MGKKYVLVFSLLAMITALMAGCSNDDRDNFRKEDQTGALSVSVRPIDKIFGVGLESSTRAADSERLNMSEIPNPRDFNISLIDETEKERDLGKLGKLDANKKIVIGKYKLKAVYGAVEEEGFGKPAFEGSSDLVIKRNQTTEVSVEPELINTKVSIRPTAAVKNYFKSIEFTVESSKGQAVKYGVDEHRGVFLKPGVAIVSASFTKQNDRRYTLEVARFETEPQHHYVVNCDVNGGEVGDASFVITYRDDNLTEQVEKIDLSDEALISKAPTVQLEGFTNNQTLGVVEGSTPGIIAVGFTATGEVKACDLNIESEYLKSKGITEHVDLKSSDGAQQLVIKRLVENGLVVKGTTDPKSKFVWVNLTDLIKNIDCKEGQDATASFKLSLTDKAGRKTETIALTVNIKNNGYKLALSKNPVVGSTEAEAQLHFLTSSNKHGAELLDGLNVSYSEDNGVQWKRARFAWVKDDTDDTNNHHILIKGLPEITKEIKLKATLAGNSAEVTAAPRVPEFSINCQPADVWSDRVSFTLTAQSPEEANVLYKYLNVTVGGKKVNLSAPKSSKTIAAAISGLESSHRYELVASCAGTTKQKEFSTEETTQLPNADFKGGWVNAPYYGRTLNKGGEYTYIAAWSAQFYQMKYEYQTPSGWVDVNAKTMPNRPATENTWYVVPSTYKGGNESQNWVTMANVGWDNRGKHIKRTFGVATVPAITELNTPEKISHKSAGRLFLGSYSYNHSNGTETYDEGIAFTSRPKGISFDYKYFDRSLGDYGYAKVQVLNKEGGATTVLAEKVIELHPSDSFTKIEENLEYKVTDKKATHIAVMFCSSIDGKTMKQSDEDQKIKLLDISQCKENCKQTGAELTVDNIKLIY